ncbi:hypothetical protein D3C86_1053320 [compost metagenome]
MRSVAERSNDLVHGRRRWTHDIGEGLAVFGHPAAHRTRAFDRVETTGFAQDRRRQPGVHAVHPFQQAPGRRFADAKVGIVLCAVASRGGQGDAGDQAHRNEIEQDVKLLRLQRVLVMETGSEGGGRANRVFHVENGIGAGNGDFGNQDRMHRIAKIDDARDALMIVRVDEDVPVIAVIVNDLRTQTRKLRLDVLFEAFNEAFQNGPSARIFHKVQARSRTCGVTQIPVEITHRARMDEALKCTVDLTERLAEAAHQFEGTLDLGQRRSVQPAHQAHRMGFARGRYRSGEVFTGKAFLQKRHGKLGIVSGEMTENGRLKLAFNARLGRVDDLQNPSRIGSRVQPVVAVALAIQRRGRTNNVEKLLTEFFGIPGRELGGRMREICHGSCFPSHFFQIAWHATPGTAVGIRSACACILPESTGTISAAKLGSSDARPGRERPRNSRNSFQGSPHCPEGFGSENRALKKRDQRTGHQP